ncbi:XopAJ/AvrRxo1 family type III secretion system effector zeta toxin [Acidovorax sp. SUPP3334]|uniref:XopAJ/AvrRxo1 family type III secretion system effector zeta toxin n=1 Tax=Acidovorax sp. SUPP3334 TaxID=2920881 RepID=UPI0023DE5DBC|nr:XopAJ/AvrRxo1 family type III secretion system effector zeta toxin [Acidovorax sp. SUPP3334]GKT21317.1 zeta toxin family protein [Acidovorax sp. SUPP3334]
MLETSANELTIRLPPEPKPSDEIFGLGKLPAPGPARWDYLAKPENWRPERQQLHDRLIGDAKAAAQTFAEVIERGGHQPTLFALRGNTATGKTRMATQTIPLLANALKESGGVGCINPDLFKRSLAETPGKAKLSSAQVHAESCVLADRLEDELRLQKTASGATASMLVDKRLAGAHEIDAYIKLAQETGRKVELCDIDASLERSLMGVLQRTPEGDAPRPPYVAVANGFSAVRGNRLDVIDKFVSNPALGSYHLFGTVESGSKVTVASVVNGELSIHDPQLYESITVPQGVTAGHTGGQVIDAALIDHLTKGIDDPARATDARVALERYAGMTWSDALAAHSSLT